MARTLTQEVSLPAIIARTSEDSALEHGIGTSLSGIHEVVLTPPPAGTSIAVFLNRFANPGCGGNSHQVLRIGRHTPCRHAQLPTLRFRCFSIFA